MGNCGVGFAPCKPERHEWLIGLMEGVEDIPGTALSEGINWNWETFPEFMDAVDDMELSIDVGLQIPHLIGILGSLFSLVRHQTIHH